MGPVASPLPVGTASARPMHGTKSIRSGGWLPGFRGASFAPAWWPRHSSSNVYIRSSSSLSNSSNSKCGFSYGNTSYRDSSYSSRSYSNSQSS
jgi:hypothetical protein